jgi:tRNA(Arg) A34 adenosine deaminase TadA
MESYDQKFIRIAIAIAQRSKANGNHPYGAVLVGPQGERLLEAENTVVTHRDCTGHAETNLMRKATRQYEADFLKSCTIYTSTEPCPMCSGAIFWGNVRRVVFGLSEARLYSLVGEDFEDVLRLPCREIFNKGHKQITVVGPILESEAIQVHEGFWK